ncbi:MAG: PD-(D/E)XK nuclease family protein [Tenuifilaceae bacterium]
MTPFLKLVADNLYKEFGKDISNLNLVFPSRRASVFFSKYLSESLDIPIWQPPTITISELMYKVSGLRQTDNLSLIIKLYNIYQKQLHTQETFDSFYFWGEVMLADFDQIDKYRVDASKLFTNIQDIKEIDEKFGGFTPEQIEVLKNYIGVITDSNNSIIRDRYLSIWKVLGPIYKEYRSNLIAEDLGYEGLAYSLAADKLQNSANNLLDGTYVFIGFNALNECEKALFRSLKKDGKAIFYWDYDTFYSESENHEAALFLRDNIYEFPNKLNREFFNNFRNDSKISLVSSPSGVTQAKLIPLIIEKLRQDSTELNINTAIVLPEEHLLLPVLSAIPEELGDLNITMGYPLKETAAYSLAEFLIRLHSNSRITQEGKVRFYHKDALSVLNHPYIQLIDGENCKGLISRINKENIIYADSSVLVKSEFLEKIFVGNDTGNQVALYLTEIFKTIASAISSKTQESTVNSRLELEYIYSLYTNINRLSDVLNGNSIDISIKVFNQLFRKALAQARVAFSGEPLSGIQIMGFLETRTLDFENLIILSVNDDVLPGNHHRPSFVTPSLRFAYGLPDYSHQDAIYGYYFYRLLQRAKNVYLIYRNRAEGLMSGELSRFVLQILVESKKKIEKIDVKFDLGSTMPSEITIEKTDNVIQRLSRYLLPDESSKSLSPSAFTSYLSCQLKFYFRYVADIREADEVAEEVDLPGFGKIIHAAMEQIYSELGKTVIEKNDLEKLISDENKIDRLIENAFAKVQFNTDKQDFKDLLAGRNLLVLEQIKFSIKKMLQTDIKRTPFSIIKQEEKILSKLSFNSNGSEYQLKIGGIVDRLEKSGETITVIDYKTGKADKKGVFANIDDLFDPKKCDNVKEVLQIFIYCMALKQQEGYADIKPALWFIRNTTSDYLPGVFYKNSSKELVEINSYNAWESVFEAKLKELVLEIYDRNIPFRQTTDKNKCKNCPYSSICNL